MVTPSSPVYPTAAPAAAAAPAWERLLARLPVEVEASARAHGALTRRRRVASAAALLRLMLAYAVERWSLRSVCAWALLAGVADLSDRALAGRLRRGRAWLGALVAALILAERGAGLAAPVRLRLVDATLLQRPGRSGSDLRAHLSLDLGRERLDGLELTDARTGETLLRHAWRPGDVAVADAAHSHRRGLAALVADGADAVVRYAWQSLPLALADGLPLPPAALAARLAALPAGAVADWPVRAVGPDGRALALRLVARRLPAAAAERKRARLRHQARKKGRTPPRSSLLLADWLLLVTTLPAERWLPEAILELYRLRWQVELAFKRLKGTWHLGALPAAGDDLAQALVLARLLAALLAERAARPLPAPCPTWWADTARPLSRGRWQALLHRALRDAVLGPLAFDALRVALPALRRFLCDPPRRRRRQAAEARSALAALVALPQDPSADPLPQVAPQVA